MGTNTVYFRKYFHLLWLLVVILFQTACAKPIALDMKKGSMADYGASPWYTEDIKLGTSKVKLSPDTGANFIWVTSNLCKTQACKNHESVDSNQSGFKWIDKTPTKRSFGPWGSMITQTAQIGFSASNIAYTVEDFYASTYYKGNQFEYLAWDGGIGFPPSSDGMSEGSSFYFASLYNSGKITEPVFSMVTYESTKEGKLYLGGENPNEFKEESAIVLEPSPTGANDWIWGTDLYKFMVGKHAISSLQGAVFFLDSGSSLFKGDNKYVTPILEQLFSIKDAKGDDIFSKVFDNDGNWISLEYTDEKGPDDYVGILPNISLNIGQSCYSEDNMSAYITLSPSQYSYYVQEGDRQGKYVPAFSLLDGIGGLLVGSTFMDLFYTTFIYKDVGDGKLNQGDMVIYKKELGSTPYSVECIKI